MLYVDGGPSTTGTVGKLRMKGREVFRHAVVNLADVLSEVLDAAGFVPADVDWVVPHQANARILDATARKLGLPPEKVIVTVDRHANTSAASVPLALDVAVRDGRIKRGDLDRARSDGRRLYLGRGRASLLNQLENLAKVELPTWLFCGSVTIAAAGLGRAIRGGEYYGGCGCRPVERWSSFGRR